jgi:hypothetical protein
MLQYPLRIEGYTAADGYPLELFPPCGLVKTAAELLEPRSTVLDVGAYTGTNGFYLADRGHKVHSLEIHPLYIEDGLRIARGIGDTALGNTFIPIDIRRFIAAHDYDAAISTHTLQMLEKEETYSALDLLRSLTRSRGLNVIRAYIGTREQQAEVPGLALFEPGELEDIYARNDWEVVTYREDLKPLRPGDSSGNGRPQPRVDSAAELIALKP